MAVPSIQPRRPRPWLLATRPVTLPAAVVPVLVGTATTLSKGFFRPLPFVAALMAAMLIQIGTNLANDYFDYQNGADTPDRLGPTRVTQSGLISPKSVLIATVITFVLAALVGLYLVLVGGWPILIIGVLSIIAGVLYTGGPWPLGYNGLGDLFVFIFFGIVAVAGTAYLHTDHLLRMAVVNSLPVAMLVTAILVVNNLRDVVTDRATGKRTLAVLLGPRAVRIEYLVLVMGAYLVPVASWLAGAASGWFWLPYVTLPLAIRLIRAVMTQDGAALNRVLAGTALLHLTFGILFAISLLL
jgi:1,4-dihydroxy-2-naphthoate octaprenyltransferase